MADVIYNSFKKDVLAGDIQLSVDTLKVMLVTSDYVPDIDLHKKRNQALSDEVVGVGYVLGGEILTNPASSQDDANDRGLLDFDDVTWSTSTITARGAVIYKLRGGSPANDELVAYLDFGIDRISNIADFTIEINASGLLAFN